MRGHTELCHLLDIRITDAQRVAMDELELRGLSFCCHFGTDNAIEILADMNRAADLGVLYEWMSERMGIVSV